VRGRIVSRLFKGSRTAVDFQVEGSKDAFLKAYVDPEVLANNTQGDEVWLGWDAANMAVLRD